ncbi:MAG: hypothetical protein JWR37_400 [Mycobacterium sp.]|nr:hypothetical protein [Mycobacterium sp.]
MKAARVRARRTNSYGHRVVNVLCPYCGGRHWCADAATGRCSSRGAVFTIATGNAARQADSVRQRGDRAARTAERGPAP